MTYATQELQTETTGYCGWSNYETWLVSLWLNNDEGYYREMVEILQEHNDVDSRANALKEWLDLLHEELEITNLWSDMVASVLWKVNWHEIADSNTEEVR